MAVSVERRDLLFSKKSGLQQVDLYMTENHGKMLVPDGVVQRFLSSAL